MRFGEKVVAELARVTICTLKVPACWRAAMTVSPRKPLAYIGRESVAMESIWGDTHAYADDGDVFDLFCGCHSYVDSKNGCRGVVVWMLWR